MKSSGTTSAGRSSGDVGHVGASDVQGVGVRLHSDRCKHEGLALDRVDTGRTGDMGRSVRTIRDRSARARGDGMTTSRQKAIGSAAERLVAAKLGGSRRGWDYGPVDVEAGNLQLQVKVLTIQPSLNAIRAMIDRIPYDETMLRGAVIGTRPGAGGRVRWSIVFDLDEYAQWYGDE